MKVYYLLYPVFAVDLTEQVHLSGSDWGYISGYGNRATNIIFIVQSGLLFFFFSSILCLSRQWYMPMEQPPYTYSANRITLLFIEKMDKMSS